MTGPTRLSVAPTGSRSRVHHATGHLTVRVMDQDADGARVGLLATQALLLSGDDVRVEVDVAPGAWLDLVETTGTIAYEGEAPSSWTVDATVGDGAVLTWAGRPFVVSDQIATHRRTRVRLHGTGRALMQEKVVLGRAGQAGGDLTMSLEASDDTGPVQVEHLDLGQQARGCRASSETCVPWTRSPPWAGHLNQPVNRRQAPRGPGRPTSPWTAPGRCCDGWESADSVTSCATPLSPPGARRPCATTGTGPPHGTWLRQRPAPENVDLPRPP